MLRMSRRALLTALAATLPVSSRFARAVTFPHVAGQTNGTQSPWFTDISSKSNFPYRSNNNFTGDIVLSKGQLSFLDATFQCISFVQAWHHNGKLNGRFIR